MRDSIKPYRVKNKIMKLDAINKLDLPQQDETGFINVTVQDAITKDPIENAKIEILEVRISGLYHETGYGDIIVTEITDSNGKVPSIELTANFEEEHVEIAEYEHIHYHMRISAEGYYYVYVTNMLVFPNITNSYRINMSSTTIEKPQYEFIITPVIP